MNILSKKSPRDQINITNTGFSIANFVQERADLILNNLLRDAFDGRIIQDKAKVPIYPDFNSERGERKELYSLFEVCFNAMKHGRQVYSYIKASENNGYLLSSFEELDYYEAKNPYGMGDCVRFVDQIKAPLLVLGNMYADIFKKNQIGQGRMFLFLDGLRGYLSSGDNSAIKERQKLVRSQTEEIFAKDQLQILLDANDRVEGLPMISRDFEQQRQIVYEEISMATGIPLTRLIGKSPNGMNATGESDQENYERTLDGIVNGLVLPILKVGDPTYKVPLVHEVDDIKLVLSGINQAGIGGMLSPKEKNAIKKILLQKIGVDFDESYSSEGAKPQGSSKNAPQQPIK